MILIKHCKNVVLIERSVAEIILWGAFLCLNLTAMVEISQEMRGEKWRTTCNNGPTKVRCETREAVVHDWRPNPIATATPLCV